MARQLHIDRRAVALAAVAASLLTGGAATPVASAAERACAPVRNPYPDTRYDGVDLRRIRAEGVTCRRARRVARRVHRKAIGLPVPADGERRFSWNGWSVRGDLRGDEDRYTARLGERRVKWVF